MCIRDRTTTVSYFNWSHNHIPGPLTNKIHTLLLVNEGLRVIKFPPAIVPAFVNLVWWATAPLGKVDGCRLAVPQDEGVVNYDIRVAEIRRAMYAATAVFNSQCAALYYVKGVARMIMPGHHFSGFDGQCSHDHFGRPVEHL